MNYILGIDQGATKTLAALADLQGNILAYGSAPGGYHAVLGLDHAVMQIRTAAEKSIRKANVEKSTLVYVGAGMTGADFPCEYRLLEDALYHEFKASNIVVNDCMAALRAESTSVNSMIICGGTGLNIGILAPDGQQFVFGYYIDECWQGGVSIGQHALRMVKDASLGIRPETKLTLRVLEYFGEQTVDSMLEQIYTKNGRENLRYLVPVVMECAAQGDKAALEILRFFAEGCSRYALAGLRRYDMMERPVTVYLSGGIFKNLDSPLNKMLTELLRKESPLTEIIDAEFEPVVGGVMIALEKAYGGEIPSSVAKQVQSSARAVGLTRKG